MPKVSIIGAGNVGATAAFVILMKKLADVVMVDIVDAVKGKALDIQQAGTIENIQNTIIGTKNYEEIKNSDIVVITAGKPRTPDMTREDLLETNWKIVKSILEEVKKHCPDAILIMVTNPLDLLVNLVIKQGFNPKKVIGQSGVLDSARFKTFLGKNSEGMVIGYHSDDMIPLISTAKINGKPITEVLTKEQINQIIERTRKGGKEIGNLIGTTAYYAPGAAIAQMTKAILNDTNEIIPCCVKVDGQYQITETCLGLPCKLNKQGAEIIEIPLSQEELNQLKESVKKRK
ncbi:MAG: malate dehydrogenase [Nanoarchaeota archaeon]|nr:malate dehydrogenase [Nanoarchaeota archaeon]